MKVLYLHQYFRKPTDGGALRSYHLSKSLVDKGMKVDLITSHNHKNIRVENIDGINVHFLPVKYDNKYGKWKRILSFCLFSIRAFFYSFKIKNIDVCYASSTPLTIGLTAILIKKWRRIPFIFEVRDLWPEAPIQMGFIRNPILKSFLYWFEKKVYQNAKEIVALSPGMKNGVLSKCPQKKVTMIPNISDTSSFKPESKDLKNEFYFGVGEKIVVSYLGAIGKVNALDSLIEVADFCQEKGIKNIHFLIAGKGKELARLKKKSQELNLTNIRFLGFLNKPELNQLLNVTDFSFISFENKPVLETNSPNKFFDSIAAGKACIVNNKGWIKDLVEEKDIGFYYPKSTPALFVENILKYKNSSLLKIQQYNARKLATSQYDKKILCQQFVKVFAPEIKGTESSANAQVYNSIS